MAGSRLGDGLDTAERGKAMGGPHRSASFAALVGFCMGGAVLSPAPVAAADPADDKELLRLRPQQKSVPAKSDPTEEIVVVASRLNITPEESTKEVQIYTKETIERSGQGTVSGFLNTLPVVSQVLDPGGLQTAYNSTGIRLHGLPLGATLVLVDGQRVAGSTAVAFFDMFDLSNIPLAAVERIEISPQGSSAIYGSDAIAGALNIVMKKNVEGLTGSVRYGFADDTHELNASLAGGGHWAKGTYSFVATYTGTSELLGKDRELGASEDFTRFGSVDSRLTVGNPGNVFSTTGANLPGLTAPYAAVPAGFTGPPSIAEFTSTAGQLNKFSRYSQYGLSPESDRVGLIASGTYDLGPETEFSLRLLYSHGWQQNHLVPAGLLIGTPAFQSYKVSAANPYNPFGVQVGIGYFFPGSRINTIDTDFYMPSIDVKGAITERWSWEVAGWASMDRQRVLSSNVPNQTAVQAALNSSNPATALNPFVAGSPGSSELVNSVLFTDDQRFNGNTFSGTAFVRGDLFKLPAGDVTLVMGSQIDQTSLHMEDVVTGINPAGLRSPNVSRTSYGVFGETRIPVLGPLGSHGDNLLEVTGAGRYDHFSDFGGNWTAEAGVVSHPLQGLSLRANWGQSFKAPSLYQLNAIQSTSVLAVFDPLRGASSGISLITGGNPHLQPQTGSSYSFGLSYEDGIAPGLMISVSNWNIHQSNSIQVLTQQVIVNNESLFPGAVTRAASCVGGPPCPIVSVDRRYTNFGEIEVAGIDYLASYRFSAVGVEWQPEISATQTYEYNVATQPSQPTTSRVSKANDDLNWAPRWKGRVALNAHKGAWSAVLAGRYTGSYRDYDPLPSGTFLKLGDIWYVDANFRCDLGALGTGVPLLKNLVLEVGAVNLFDQQPQFSNLFSGVFGYDLLEADIRGRFVYFHIEARL